MIIIQWVNSIKPNNKLKSTIKFIRKDVNCLISILMLKYHTKLSLKIKSSVLCTEILIWILTMYPYLGIQHLKTKIWHIFLIKQGIKDYLKNLKLKKLEKIEKTKQKHTDSQRIIKINKYLRLILWNTYWIWRKKWLIFLKTYDFWTFSYYFNFFL